MIVVHGETLWSPAPQSMDDDDDDDDKWLENVPLFSQPLFQNYPYFWHFKEAVR